MILYLAGFSTVSNVWDKPTDDIWLLSSFWEHKGGRFGEYVYQSKHILDSGAFSAINDRTGKYKNFDWNEYVNKYIAFIIQTKQKKFFELDIDCVVGLERVEYYRKKIEDAVGIAPIPVWHSNRGKDYFHFMCENYETVAIGTTNANEDGRKIRKNPLILNWFINEAHRNGCKIHGLGFTSTKWLPQLKFDSVDSTTWVNGQKYASIVQFNGKGFDVFTPDEGQKGINPSKRLVNNFVEWVKYQKYAEDFL